MGRVPFDDDTARLRPEMASFRALVLDFVRNYILRWNQSPSLGEIAAATRSNRTRVKRAIASLVKAGLLVRVPGPRGLSLPDELAQARAVLERAGLLHVPSSSGALGQQGTVTKATLLPPPALDYPAQRTGAARGQRNGASSETGT